MNVRVIVVQFGSSVLQLDVKNELVNLLLSKLSIKSLIINHKTVFIKIDTMLFKKALKIRIGSPYVILTNVS